MVAPQDRLSSVKNLQCQAGQLLPVVSEPSLPVVIETHKITLTYQMHCAHNQSLIKMQNAPVDTNVEDKLGTLLFFQGFIPFVICASNV